MTYQAIHIDDVAAGLLYYVAQSFLLAFLCGKIGICNSINHSTFHFYRPK